MEMQKKLILEVLLLKDKKNESNIKSVINQPKNILFKKNSKSKPLTSKILNPRK